ncbi:hypothetical protein C7293_28385 [filamentous cyanobacterium CCT1]|nr:hypothetical protein C7293_28385 [filamentous cyanobacterium CCT1]PSN76643.1 hypothetical protein C8B47_26240 [filamentous cyanobacterium CCP4]
MGLALSCGIQASHEVPLPIHFVLFETPCTATLSRLFCTTKTLIHYIPNHAPIWTQIGVAALGLPTMRIEIRVTAIIP